MLATSPLSRKNRHSLSRFNRRQQNKFKIGNDIIKKPVEGKAANSQIEREAMLNSLKASLAKINKP
jgi:hypothetical protein